MKNWFTYLEIATLILLFVSIILSIIAGTFDAITSVHVSAFVVIFVNKINQYFDVNVK